jgi:4-aminobutyrate aminotransferase
MAIDRHHPPTVDLSEGDSNLSIYRRSWAANTLSPKTNAWLRRDAEVFVHQTLSTPCLNVLSHCSGSHLVDLEGRRILDFHGNSAHQVGFAHPRVITAVKEQINRLAFCTRRYTHPAIIELAEKLVAVAPESLDKVLFAPGGTTAISMALKTARAATGRFKTISMWDAFHGASLDAMSISGETMFRKAVGPLLTGAQLVPPAEPYRCILEPSGDCDTCGLKCAQYIDYVLQKEGDVAAVVAEPIRNTAVNPPPAGYWQAVRSACDRHGALLILDETAVCLGRTGHTFACETFGVTPDILTIGKGLGGGMIPMAAMLVRADLVNAPEKVLGHYTHEKNPLGAAAGLAVLDILENARLAERAADLGHCSLDRLAEMRDRHPLIGDMRGVGLVMGIELVTDRQTKARAVDEADRLMYACLAHGLSFKTSQGSFIPLSPPLTIARDDLDQAFNIIDHALTEIETQTQTVRPHGNCRD